MNKHKVFLGGTCNNSNWRDKLIPLLEINYFNPVVINWTPEDIKLEELEKSDYCDIHLYYITSEMKGYYSLMEAGLSAGNPRVYTIFQVDPTGFTDELLDNFDSMINLINKSGGEAFFDDGVEYLAEIINKYNK